MNYSCWALFWLTYLLGFCAIGRADTVWFVNGSSNLAYSASLPWGEVNIPPGAELTVYANPGSTISNFVAGSNSVSWTIVAGHDYRAVCPIGGTVQVNDLSPGQTYWFWLGFATFFCMGLFSWAASWARHVLGGGEN
jgi:hypothetical protein